ncbi:MAG: OmpA family protein [Elusimicrobia bacterium]|nr:OmpA family protein [Candidatus Liberimonas magnetica]
MRKSRLSAALLVIFIALSTSYAVNLSTEGYLSIKGDLDIDYYSHKLGDNWDSSKASYKGINYNYTYNPSSHTTNSWSNVSGETLNLSVNFNPNKYINGDLGFEFIKDYADRYWMPVNFEHKLSLDNNNFSWTSADISYNRGWFHLNYFRGIGHYHWGDKGDLFNLYPEQFETDRYLRVSGRPVPEGYGAVIRGKQSKLEIVYGPEAVWNYRKGYYLNYSIKILGLNNHLIYVDNIIPYGDPDERMRSFELSTKYDDFQLGFLYQPFRLNRDYTYVEETGNSLGFLGTNYLKKTGTTNSSDALGISTKFKLLPGFIFDSINLQYSYLGLVAGNKQEISTQFDRRISNNINSTIGYKYRKPLLGPIPLVYQGTASNKGPALFEPRGPESPFWVGWNYAWDNREASILSFTLSFDPTPNTPFYYYQPNVLDEWNLNKKENAKLSFAANYTLTRYPSNTDRLLFYDEQGNMVWEPYGATGAWPTNGYIGAFKLISIINTHKWRIFYDLGFGEALASSSLAYTLSDVKEKPITDYVTTGISCQNKFYTVKLRYGQDVWGPEQWHSDFGEAIDKLYQFSLSRKFGDYLTAGVEYTGVKEIDYKYLAPELGDYDEVRCFVKIYFGPVTAYLGSEEKKYKGVVKKPVIENIAKDAAKPNVPASPQPQIKNVSEAAKDILKDVSDEMKISEDSRGLVLTSTVLFDSNESELSPGSERVMNKMSEVLKIESKNKIVVEGYTDDVGRDSYNQRLSEKRAQSVANFFINAGIDAERIEVKGYGSKKPVASNKLEKGREANRRVEVIILK